MKKHLTNILISVLCVLLVICMVQITNIRNEIHRMENGLSNNINSLAQSVENVIPNINNLLEEQSSLLASADFQYGELNIDSKTVEIKLSITPKAFSVSDTSATIVCNDKEYPLGLKNGSFVGDIDIPLFSESYISNVMFKEGDIVRSELLNQYFSPRYDFLPLIDITQHGYSGWTKISEGQSYEIDKVFEVSFSGNINHETESVTLVEKMNGNELSRSDFKNGELSNVVPSNVVPAVEVGKTQILNLYYNLSVKKKIEIPSGSTYELFVEVVDGHGFIYRTLVERVSVNQEGDIMHDDQENYFGEPVIYDSRGKLLFGIEY